MSEISSPDGAIDALADYDLDAISPHLAQSTARYLALNAALAHPRARLDVAYGQQPRERMDVFPAALPNAPVLMFFHGGYWKGGAKEDRRFPARSFNAAGAAWITVEYPLCPEASIGDIVVSARRAVAFAARNAASWGADPARIHVGGNSAGGQIAAMLAIPAWYRAYGLNAHPVKSAAAISGVFDLRPLLAHAMNAVLRLSPTDAERWSPMLQTSERAIPMTMAVGALEPPAFQAQSRLFFDRVRKGVAGDRLLSVENCDHFSIIGELDREGSALQGAIFARMGIG